MNDSVSARPVRDRLWSALGGSGDLARAVVIGVVQVAVTYLAAHNQPERRHLGLLGSALLAAGPAALAVRRRWPLPVLAFVLAVTVAYYVLGYPFGPVFLALIVAFFTAVTRGYRRGAWLLAAAGLSSWFALQTLLGWGPPPATLHVALVAGWLLVVLTVSEIARAGRQRAVEAEQARRQESRRRADEERLRIARELHDVVAHNISLINVQAGVALHLIDERPEQARTALAAIKQASNEALGARSTRRRRGRRRPGWPAWTTWSPARGPPAWRCAPGSRASHGRCPPASTWPPSASCRRPSPTSPGTPARRAPPSASPTATPT
jgi:uncharacterized membrane protein (UPF0136 family)